MSREHEPADQQRDPSRQRSGDTAQGTLTLSEGSGYVGDTLTIRGEGLPPNDSVEIRWHSTWGRWGVIEANEIVGPQYQSEVRELATVTTDDDGVFTHEWTVFEDYGGAHTVVLTDGEGTVFDQTRFEILPWFELDRTTATLGSMLTLTGYGIGPETARSNYQVTWDNGYVGMLTGVQNRGTSRAQIRAVGPPGTHVLQVWRNFRGIPYLQNNTQSHYGPVAQGRQYRWTVEVAEPTDPPEAAWVDPQLDETPIAAHYPDIQPSGDAELSITPQSGPSGTSVFLRGEGFPAETTVDLVWYRHEGHHMKGNSITAKPAPEVLPSAETGADGTFQVEAEIPVGQGGTRPIAAVVDGTTLALTGFVVQPAIERFEPTSGPVGTDIEIELSGIGWTAYENQPFFLYDNKPLGIVSGTTPTNRNGVVRVEIPATGDHGWHCIDVYPTLSAVQADEPDFELWPHLSAIENHPMRPLPAMHFTFEVTE
jgi:hypothetical protein